MRVGLFLPSISPYATPEYLAAFAGAAEEHGFASVWLGEHVVFVDEYDSKYPYAADGRVGLPPDSGMLGLFPTVGFLAATTTRLRIGTAICLVPQRNPVYTAQDVATADWLSGGRLDFGVGIGWLREEFRALGVPWEERAARTEEYLEIMRRLWCDDVSEYEGRFHRLTPCRMNPKPTQKPHPPIYFGGETDAALRRVARLGDGWHGFNHSPETAATHVARLEGFLAEAGRTRSDIDVTVAAYLRPVEPTELAAYRDAGVDQLVLSAFGTGAHDVRDVIATLADSFVERAGAL
jgi:probable F420-dependent oxidoreductase